MQDAPKKNKQITQAVPLHRILREVLRHYIEYRELVAQDGRNDIIDYGYWVYNEDGTRNHKEDVSISFWDLHRGIKELAPRKREALWYNVICDMKQRDVAKIMHITTVSVGQYTQNACEQLVCDYFMPEEIEKK
jgi:DNA-directed RNA polymerase specialized sigma24 family protein